MSLPRAEVIDRLSQLSRSYTGGSAPGFLNQPNAWVEPLADTARAALALIPEWRPIGDAPVPSPEQLIEEKRLNGYEFPCLIQTSDRRVTFGVARYGRKQGYARDAKGAEVYELRWYSHQTGWLKNAKYFMPLPAARED